MKKIIIIILFSLFSFNSYGKLFYKCNHVYIGARLHNDINVIFMTGYEVLENLPSNNLSIVKAKKYAMVLLNEEISVVLLDDPDLKLPVDQPTPKYYNPDYNTNCRLEYTKRCLPDLGNSTLTGQELGTGKKVSIYPNNFIN